MQSRNSYIQLLLGILVVWAISACTDVPDGFSKTESGLAYKYVYLGDEEVKPVKGNQVLLQITQIDETGQSMPSYTESMVFEERKDTGLQELVSKLYVGDRLQAYVDPIKVGMASSSADQLIELEVLRIQDHRELDLKNKCEHLPTMFIDHWGSPIVDSILGFEASSCILNEGMRIIWGHRGEGLAVSEARLARLDYEGYLLDGTKFDSTYDRDEPFEWEPQQRDQVLEGFDDIANQLKAGDELWLLLPPYKAFGSQGSTNGAVSPGATVIYHIKVRTVE